METLLQDLRYGLRMLRKKPTFTIMAVLTLALGVGVNTAMFSIVDAVLLRPLPFREPDRLVKILFNEPGRGVYAVRFSVPELEDLRNRAGVFEQVCAMARGSVVLTGGLQPERLEMVEGNPNYFSMLGATPQIGRLFGSQDVTLGYAPVVVISDSLWRRNFAADPNVIGRTIYLDKDPYTIIGVLPAEFRHPGRASSHDVEVWITSGFSAAPELPPARSNRNLSQAYGRLKPGVTLAQAQDRLTTMANQLRHEYATDYPAEGKRTMQLQPLQDALVGKIRPTLLLLQGAVILIGFIVALNIANLLLACASGRQQEMVVRSALGASRGRIVRQMLTESLLLSVMGGAAGITLAVGALRFMMRFIPSIVPRGSEVTVNWVVLSFALLIFLLSGLFGLAPAIHSSKSDLSTAIREGGWGSSYSTKTGRLRDALIVSELAMAVVLMIGSGLLLRTLRDLLQENPGFNPTQVVAASVNLPASNDPRLDRYFTIAQQSTFHRELRSRMNAIPGVELAGFVSDLPDTRNPFGDFALGIQDRPSRPGEELRAEPIVISPDYFKVMQVPLVRGRYFAEDDQNGKLPVAIVDESTARRYWPDRDPLGSRLHLGQNPTSAWRTIVGIVKDVKHDGLDVDGAPHVYISIYQEFDVGGIVFRNFSIVLRTSLPASILEPQIHRAVQGIDPDLPVFDVTSMNEVLDRSLVSRRLSAQLVGGFAGLAILLASIGIYGLLAYMVGQRSREIGLRMALGAGRADILKLILQKGMLLAGVGVIVGVILSASAASMMASLLYGVSPRDPEVFLIVPLLLFAVAVVSSYVPAQRATKVDPMAALREA